MRALLMAATTALLLAVPLASSAPLSSEIVSDSPVELFGKIIFRNDGLAIHHQAPREGSMRGTLYNATLFDLQTIQSTCPNSPPRQTPVKVMEVRGGDLANIMRLSLGRGAHVIFEPKDSKDLPLSDGSASQASLPDATAPLLLAPNTYVHANVENESAPGSPYYRGPSFGETFSTHPFLVVPTARFDSSLPGNLFLESGDLTISRGDDQPSIYTPRTDTQRVECQGPLPLTPPGGAEQTIHHSYYLVIVSGTLAFEQGGLDNLRAYFAGDRPLGELKGRDREQAPPPGHWYENDPEGLDRAYQELNLPYTYFVAEQTSLGVAGAGRFAKAFGTISEGQNITEVDRRDVVLSGNLGVMPVTASDGGRRTTTRLDGSLFVLDVELGGSRTDWTPLLAAAGAGVLGAAGFVALWPQLKWRLTQLLLFPLYARLKKEDILENPLRDDILHVVQTTPGISASELGRRLECGWGTLVYHITVLERMGLVSSAREGRHKRFFAQGRINYSDKGAVALLANPAARTILDAIRHHPGLIQKELGEQLGLAPGTISWHVERLASEGLILKEGDGRVVRYFPSERLLELTKQLAA